MYKVFFSVYKLIHDDVDQRGSTKIVKKRGKLRNYTDRGSCKFYIISGKHICSS